MLGGLVPLLSLPRAKIEDDSSLVVHLKITAACVRQEAAQGR